MSTVHPIQSQRPAAGPPRDYRFPRFERRTLENGLQVIVAPVTKLPLATVLLVVDAGAIADPVGSEGLAMLTAQLLLEGTEGIPDGAQLTERFERLGAAIDAHATWDAALLRMTAKTDRLEAAMALFGEVVMTPTFPAREVERLRAERLAELLQQRAEPRGLADEMFERFTYDPASRYARPDGGSEASVRAITRDDVAGFHERRFRPVGATLIIAGDVSMDEGVRLASASLGGWHGDAPSAALTTDAPARHARAIHLVAKEDAPQSELRIGHPGVPRAHPDYFPIVVMNAVLGGLFSSRINLNLRERNAYTYGAFSEFDWRRQAGPFVVSTAVKSDVTDAAAREVLHEIDRMRAEEIAEDELTLATSYLDGVFPIRYETTAAIASALASLVIYRLPDDYFDTYRAHIRAVTRSDVLDAARAHLDPDALQMVIVGDPRAIQAPLEKLGFGDMTVYDAMGIAPGDT